MLKFIEFRHIQYQPKLWYFILFFLTLLIGVIFSIYVSHAQDEEMLCNLITYTNAIEQYKYWKPFLASLNVNPNQIKASYLAQLEMQF